MTKISVSERIRLLAGTAAVAAFSSFTPALASGDVVASHPLLQPQIGGKYNMYKTDISIALSKASGVSFNGVHAGNFAMQLEEALRAGPLNRPQMVWMALPKGGITPGVLLVGGVVPPATSFATANIPFCADQNMAIVYKGHITLKGEIIPDNSANPTPTSEGRRPCQDWLLAKGKEMVQPPDKADNAGRPAASLPAK